MPTKVLIVDDHPLFRRGLRSILNADSTIEIVGEAENGQEAIDMAKELKPNIIIMDVSMPSINGIDATNDILSFSPDIKILALSIHTGKRFVQGMIDAGAVGYLIKDSAPEELLTAVKKILNAEMYLSSEITSIALSTEENQKDEPVILSTKLHRPSVSKDYIKRGKILQYLENNKDKPLTVISAPTGYGKSVVASQWLEHCNSLHAWISLDDEHNNFRTFLSYLNASIETVFPGSLDKMRDLLNAIQLPPLNTIAHTFINEIDLLPQDFILTLDDFNEIKNLEIYKFIDEILCFPPEQMHLLIITRKDPPLKLSTLRINGRMNEVRMDKLCFSESEILVLFKKLMNIELKEETIKSLHEKTEGWIVGLRLASLMVKNNGNADIQLKNVKNDSSFVSDYLIKEVLYKQSDFFKDQLILSSILNRFNNELLDLIFKNIKNKNRLNGFNFIQELINSDLFVIPLDNHRKWFRYHHLFKEILHNLVKENYSSKEIEKFHMRVSVWFETNGFIGEAIEHAMKANKNDKAIEIIEKAWALNSVKNTWKTVDDWLAYLPGELINQSIGLLLIRAWIEHAKYNLNIIPIILRKINQCNGKLNNYQKGCLAFFNGVVSFYKGNGVEAIKFLDQALHNVTIDNISIRSDIEFYRSLSFQMLGQVNVTNQNSLEIFNKLNSSENELKLIHQIEQETVLNLMDANIFMAQLKIRELFNLKNFHSGTFMFSEYLSGSVNYWNNNLKKAIYEFDRTINRRYHSNYRQTADSYISKALCLHYLHKSKEAKETIDKLKIFAEEVNDIEINTYVSSGEARLALLQGNISFVKNWLNSLSNTPLNASMMFWVDTPEITRCRLLIAKGSSNSLEQAIELLDSYVIFSESVHNKLRTIEISILQSIAFHKQKNKKKAIYFIKKAIQLANKGNWIRPFVEVDGDITKLLQELVKKNEDAEFINYILKCIAEEKTLNKPIKRKKYTKSQNSKLSGMKEMISTRELQVLNLVAEGLRNKEIAEQLFVSDDTVKKHLYHIFQKMNVSNRTGMVTKAKKIGIL